MKNNSALFICLSLFLYSCSTKFKVGADYKEVSVVYGLLSSSDTAHYIKITKGYFDETSDNLALAQNTDSLYFPNLQVEVQVLNNGNPVQTIPLNRVDLTLEGYPKATGVFGTIPNYAYKFKTNLDANRTYRLKIKNLDTGKEIEGETPIISTAKNAFQFVQPYNELENLNFSDPLHPYLFKWKGPSSAAFYDVVIQFRYQEVSAPAFDTVYITKNIPVVKNVLSSSGEISAYLSSIDFFKQLNSALGYAPNTTKRFLDTPGVAILAGGSVLKTYIDVNSIQGGITYDQIKPNYTNLSGENVYGILSTRGQISIPVIKFNQATTDSILSGSNTLNLNFVGMSTK